MKNLYKTILFGFATALLAVPALAQEAATAPAAATADTATIGQLATVFSATGGWIALAAGLCIAIAAFGGAMGQSRAAVAALDGVARNPAASGKLTLPLILSLALIESLVIYALVIAFQLNAPVGAAMKALTPAAAEAQH
jgi:F-type H+-transporting ATPase subunit c